jgi:hypothetical protein
MKKIIAIVILVALAVWGYMAFSGKETVPAESTETTTEVSTNTNTETVPAIEVVKADPKVLALLKNVSVTASEDGNKVALVNGKAEFSIEGSSTKGSVSLGEVAIEKTFGSRKDILATVNINPASSGTSQYLVLFENKTSGVVEKSIVFLGDKLEVKSITTTDLGSKTGEEYVALVTVLERKQGEPMSAKPSVQKIFIFTVEKGVFNTAKSLSI